MKETLVDEEFLTIKDNLVKKGYAHVTKGIDEKSCSQYIDVFSKGFCGLGGKVVYGSPPRFRDSNTGQSVTPSNFLDEYSRLEVLLGEVGRFFNRNKIILFPVS